MEYRKYKLSEQDVIDNKVEIIALGDLHIGDSNCDYKLLNRHHLNAEAFREE